MAISVLWLVIVVLVVPYSVGIGGGTGAIVGDAIVATAGVLLAVGFRARSYEGLGLTAVLSLPVALVLFLFVGLADPTYMDPPPGAWVYLIIGLLGLALTVALLAPFLVFLVLIVRAVRQRIGSA